jgi:hypothetical protein
MHVVAHHPYWVNMDKLIDQMTIGRKYMGVRFWPKVVAELRILSVGFEERASL